MRFLLSVACLCLLWACKEQVPAQSSSSSRIQSLPQSLSEWINQQNPDCEAILAQDLELIHWNYEAQSWILAHYTQPKCADLPSNPKEVLGLYRQNSLGQWELLDERYAQHLSQIQVQGPILTLNIQTSGAPMRQAYQIIAQKLSEVQILSSSSIRKPSPSPINSKPHFNSHPVREHHIPKAAPPAPPRVLRAD